MEYVVLSLSRKILGPCVRHLIQGELTIAQFPYIFSNHEKAYLHNVMKLFFLSKYLAYMIWNQFDKNGRSAVQRIDKDPQG